MRQHTIYIMQMPLEKEIETWIGLLIDHARFLRNGFDTTEELYFQRANNFSEDFVELSHKDICALNQDSEFLNNLNDEVNNFIMFKNEVARETENCQVLSILPAALIDHIMKEAIYFSGILARIQDKPGPGWSDIGLPDTRIAQTLPQALIPLYERDLEVITWEELLFWLEINYEHANVLSLYFRPEQEALRRQTLRWGIRIERLYNQVLRAYLRQMSNPERFIEPGKDTICEWTEFLRNLYRQIAKCNIPGGQMNIWPRVIDHMIREAIYFIQVLSILNRLYRA
ncbi:MAG: DUF2935 domain-containing protein [Halanaerobiales bacterium]